MVKHAWGMVIVAALGVCVAAGTARAADGEMVDNPSYKSWAGHNVGTTVTHAGTTDAGGRQFKSVMSQKLVELTKDKAVVETTTKLELPGAPEQPAQKQEILAKVKKSEIVGTGTLPKGVKGQAKEKGKEKVEAAGKTYECRVWEVTAEVSGAKTTGKTWTSEAVPGTLVKMEANTDAGGQKLKMTTALTKVESK